MCIRDRHQPHVPRVPSERFRGATELGPRGDVIVEMDWCVGELYKELQRLGILEDTMIVFSSDNGPVLDDGYLDGAYELNGTHKPTGPLRGGKYSKFDGGSRIPFIVSLSLIHIWGMKELERRVNEDCRVAFAMYPTSISELFAVADAGELMPPKSTWFEPKLRSGLFIHSLREK